MIVNLAGLTVMILISGSSDRKMERRFHAAIPSLIAGSALLLAGTPHGPLLTVVLLSLAACGYWGFINPFWALPNEFLTGYSAAIGIALINSVGNLGGLVGPYVVGAVSQATGTLQLGLAVCALPVFLSGVLLLLLRSHQGDQQPIA
jgi:ACS family tartrate transporter-like MFS transporter